LLYWTFMDACFHCQLYGHIVGMSTVWQAFTPFTGRLHWHHVFSMVVETSTPHTIVSLLMLPLIELRNFEIRVKLAPKPIHCSSTYSKSLWSQCQYGSA
jgi:hypothetical protein